MQPLILERQLSLVDDEARVEASVRDRADDLVETRRDGKNVYYSLARDEVREIITALHRAFCKPGR